MPSSSGAKPPPSPFSPAMPPDLGERWLSAQPAVRAFLLAATANFHDAQELLQRTALAVVAQAGRFDPAKPFAPWAMGIAKIEVLRFRRDQARSRLSFGAAALAALETAFAKVEPEADPRLAALVQCLQTLRGKAREAIRLAYTEGLSGERAAERMGIEPGYFFVLLSRARSSLRHCVEAKLHASQDHPSP